jgi:sulfur carrier protein
MASTIRINGELAEVELPRSLAIIVAQHTGTDERRGYAVARNGEVIPRSTWDAVVVEPGDELEIAAPFAGG